MAIETEAYVARGTGGPRLEKIKYLDPGPKDLLIDIVAASVCHTDVKASEGTFHMKPPLILGHEAAGYVKSVGSGVTYVQPGDAVVLSYANCGACKNCLSGMAAYCEDLFVLNFTGKSEGKGEQSAVVDEKGEVVNGLFFGQSSMSRVALCHESCAVKVDARDKDELIKFASLGVRFFTSLAQFLLNDTDKQSTVRHPNRRRQHLERRPPRRGLQHRSLRRRCRRPCSHPSRQSHRTSQPDSRRHLADQTRHDPQRPSHWRPCPQLFRHGP